VAGLEPSWFVVDAKGTLAVQNALTDYWNRPVHSKTHGLCLYLFYSSWRLTKTNDSNFNRLLVIPGYEGEAVEGQNDDDPIPAAEAELVTRNHPLANSYGWAHKPGTVPFLLGPKIPLKPDEHASAAEKDEYALRVLVLFKP
jgi:hypothetical protein